MKRTMSMVAVLVLTVIGIALSAPRDCMATQAVSISDNTAQDVIREKESNDTAATATGLSSGVQTAGTLGSAMDVDYYAYTIETDGYMTFGISVEGDVAKGAAGWNMYIYDMAGEELCSYSKLTEDFTSQKLNFERGTTLYLKVCADRSGNAPIDLTYYVCADAVFASDWEVETRKQDTDKWNARIKEAAQLSAEPINGSLWTGSDDDVYMLFVPKTGKVILRFGTETEQTTLGWGYDIEVYRKKGEKAVFYRQIKQTTQKTFYARKGTYYVVIKANWSNSPPPATDTYKISAALKSDKIPSMKGKKLKYTPKTSTLKWKGVKGVDGYEVQVCKNKKFKASQTNVYTTVEKMYKLPRRLKRGTYYVKVRAYCDTVTGERIYGKYSKVKKIKRK